MPNIPGANTTIGQGEPGGAAALPGIGNIPGANQAPSFSLPTFHAPTAPNTGLTPVTTTPLPTSPTAFTSFVPSFKAHSMANAMSILDQVHAGKISWQDASKALDAGLNGLERDILKQFASKTYGDQAIDALRALGDTNPQDTLHPHHSILTNLGGDISSFVKGAPAGIGLTAKYAATDLYNATVHGKGIEQGDLATKVIEPVAHSLAQTYGPLVHGDLPGFYHQFHSHPLGPILDLLSVASAGVGLASRASAVTRAIDAGSIVRRGGGILPKNAVAAVGQKAGLSLSIHPLKSGLFQVRDRGKIVATNFPTADTAIAHAQSLATGGISGSALKLAFTGAKRAGTQGNLIDAYEKARGITHDTEEENIMKEISSVFDDPNIRLDRRTGKETFQDVLADLRATRAAGRAKPIQMSAEQPGFISPTVTGRALGTMGTSLREASDLVRAGAIYLRVGYLPNNWAGNEFMNIVQQGALAPVNMAKALVITKHMDPLNLRAMRQATGTNAARAIFGDEGERIAGGRARGYIASLTEPVAHVMGALADQPFRDSAFLHEARRQGYRTIGSVDKLFDAARTDEIALRKVANIGRRSSEEIVKFQHMNDLERTVARNIFFVYSWMRGATRYGARFPFAHPIQAATYSQLSNVGNDWLAKEMGGVPNFLIGAIPVGHDSKGNPLLINPFSLNPLGTALQVGQAAAGTANVLQNPKSFNKYAQTDAFSLMSPLLQAYENARNGGKSPLSAGENSIALYRLAQELQHPGSGSIYPTSRTEAIGHFLGGTLYPRQADQAAITKSLERENSAHPSALIPEQLSTYKKATGQTLPKEFVNAYKADLAAIQLQKDFQTSYASAHGASGFRGLPAQNRAEAALEYLTRHSLISPTDLQQYQSELAALTNDTEFNDFANALWNSTGVGQIKREWDSAMRDAIRSTSLTRKRK